MKRLYISLIVSAGLILACGVSTLPTAPQSLAGVEKQPVSIHAQIVPVANPITGTVTAETALTVRATPSDAGRIVGYLRPGEIVTIRGNLDGATEACSGWLQTTGGYVCKEFVLY